MHEGKKTKSHTMRIEKITELEDSNILQKPREETVWKMKLSSVQILQRTKKMLGLKMDIEFTSYDDFDFNSTVECGRKGVKIILNWISKLEGEEGESRGDYPLMKFHSAGK